MFEGDGMTQGRMVRIGEWAAEHALALVVLAGAFVARLLLADWNSYWLDELYSVSIYGIWNDTALDAIRHLAATSVHPPLYQFVLFHWMAAFGDSEIATRTLSNLYMTLAGLFLYLIVYRLAARWLAVCSVALFSIMYTTMYYGLESRSYAQTIFLVALSSYLLIRILEHSVAVGWRRALVSPSGSGLVVVNAALLLTHYFNAFFLGAQALMAVVFVLIQMPPRSWPRALGAATILFATPMAIFLGVWGRFFLSTFDRRAGDFEVDPESTLVSPLGLLSRSVLNPNLSGPTPMRWLVPVLAVLAVLSLVEVVRGRSELGRDQAKAWASLYLVGWILLPLVVTYAVFSVTGVARYSNRYFMFGSVPLVAAVLVTAHQVSSLLSRRLASARGDGVSGLLVGFLAVLLAISIVPGTVAAATFRKADWRGTANTVVGMVEQHSDRSFLIFETSFRSTPVFDYYLGRYSQDLRVSSTIRRHQERSGGPFSFETSPELLEGHDFLVVTFIHHRPRNFPIAMERLTESFELQLSLLGGNGRGFIVFRLNGD